MSLNKSLLRNEKDYDDLKRFEGGINWFLGEPVKYPCICAYKTNTSDSGWDYIDGEFIYIDDFQDCVPNGNADGIGI